MIEQSTTNTQRDKTHQWPSPPDPSTNHNKALQQRHAGTGHWFVKGETFSSFKDGTVPILWLHGIPGCGKTVLSSTIIEDLRVSSGTTATALLLYFYFDFNDQRKQTFDSVLRSLVCQMAHQSDGGFEQLDHLNRNRQPSSQELSQILEKMLNGGDHVTIVLDALDECTTRDELLKWIQQLMASEIGSLKMVVTSRKEYDISLVLEKIVGEEATIPLQQHDVDVDIHAYVHARIRTDSDWERWRSKPQVQDEIEIGLMEKASGMFRWAACQLDSLAKCVSRRQLTQALATLPATLDGTYARILDQIPDEYRQDSIRLLQVLTWTKRSLRIEELVDYLAVDLHNEPGFDVENRMPVPTEIVRLCSSLVTIVEIKQDLEWDSDRAETSSNSEEGESKYEFGAQGEQTTREMRLAHFSVKEYIISERLDERYQVHLRRMPSAACIASALLTYLLNIGGDIDLAELKTKFPLSHYSARYWIDFAALAETSDDSIPELAMRLLSDRRACARWLSLYDPEFPWREEPRNRREPLQPLYYAALCGLERSTSALIDESVDVNAQGGEYGNPLQAACSKGHKKIAEILISNGADNAPRGYKSTALQAACAEGHEKTAELLLSHDVDVNAPGQKYGAALQAACAGGYEKIAEMLLSNGADVDAQGGNYGNALQAACAGGYKKIAEILLSNSADVDAQGGIYGNALRAACTEGYEGIAEMLLNNGADVDDQGGFHGNALQAACARRHEKVAEMLLSHGADVNARGGCYGSALNAACFRGYESMAKWLLDNGANVNAQSEGVFSNAVSAARDGGHEQIVEMLLARGSDPPAPSHRERRER
ncbi:hypothetical protein LTR12_007627 [Friedmanniomyces endolithicus]|nr:hypothetical protein LTR74_006102 [Friedmanniomyces endolithicus]KAK1817992.1 hypothetical protein LTR12_007627 [Friedmanniomyces endolithicus]